MANGQFMLTQLGERSNNGQLGVKTGKKKRTNPLFKTSLIVSKQNKNI